MAILSASEYSACIITCPGYSYVSPWILSTLTLVVLIFDIQLFILPEQGINYAISAELSKGESQKCTSVSLRINVHNSFGNIAWERCCASFFFFFGGVAYLLLTCYYSMLRLLLPWTTPGEQANVSGASKLIKDMAELKIKYDASIELFHGRVFLAHGHLASMVGGGWREGNEGNTHAL